MATLDWTTNKSSVGFQAQKPMWVTRTFDFACNLPAGTTGKMTTCDTARLFKLDPNTRVLEAITLLVTKEAVSACVTLGITGTCLNDPNGLDTIDLCANAAGTYFESGFSDGALKKSTGKCAAYVTMYNCQAVCLAKINLGLLVVRDSDH